MEFLFSFFQIIKYFEYILRILSRELILVFNESLSCLNKIMIIFNLIESDDFLFDSIDFVQLLLFLLNSFCFFSFSLNNNSFRFGFLFWGLIVSSFEFFIGGFKFLKELIDTLLVLGWKLILVFNEGLFSLNKIIIIFYLIESDDFLFDSIVFIQFLLFLLNSLCFFDFSLINNGYWLSFLFWGLIVYSFEFFIGGFKFFKELIDTLLVLGWKLILFINELLAKLHVFSLVMMSFLNAVHLVRLWKKHA